jgi:hypothetical protein
MKTTTSPPVVPHHVSEKNGDCDGSDSHSIQIDHNDATATDSFSEIQLRGKKDVVTSLNSIFGWRCCYFLLREEHRKPTVSTRF